MSLKPATFEEGKARAARYAEKRKGKILQFGHRRARIAPETIQGVEGGNGIPDAPNASRTKQGKKRKGFRSVTRDQADHFFSLFIRYRDNWTCQRCGSKYEPVTASLQCSHFYGRARENTRFDPINADAQCAGCHNFLGANPELHREWKLQRIGEDAYMKLRVRAESRCKKDRKLMAMICKKLFEDEKKRFESSS